MIKTAVPLIGGGDGPYITAAARFDGTNDNLTLGSDLTGASDGKLIMGSMWLLWQGSDATANIAVVDSGNTGLRIPMKSTDDKYRFDENTGSAGDFDMLSDTTYTTSDAWHHVLFSIDVGNSRAQLYVDDASDVTSPTIVDGTLDFTQGGWGVGARSGGAASTRMQADIADLWIGIGQSLDLSTASNRRKFISASGKPVDLGADGSTPTGTAPNIFLRLAPGAAASTFATNLGTGQDFSITGALEVAPTSPTD